MSTKVSDRFQKIPRLQQARETEYTKQASEAEALLRRLHQTRVEAESVAREEISRTRSIQVQEFQNHPEMVKWRKSIAEARMNLKNWDKTAGYRKQELQNKIQKLEQKLKQKQGELERAQRDIEAGLGKERELEESIVRMQGELKGLHSDYEEARQLESITASKLDNSFSQYNFLQKEIEDLKAKRDQYHRDIENLRSRESGLKAERESLLNEIDRLRSEMTQWEERMSQVEDSMFKAERLQAEAQEMVENHRQRIEGLKGEQGLIQEQLQQAKDQRIKALATLGRVKGTINEKQSKVKELEEAARPVKARIDEIQQTRKSLEEEEAMLTERFSGLNSDFAIQNSELEHLKPAQDDAQSQVDKALQLLQGCEEQFNGIFSVISEEEKKMKEYEAKAEEAHREVHEAKRIAGEVGNGCRTVSETSNNVDLKIRQVDQQLNELQGRIGQLEHEGFGPQLEGKQAEFERYEKEYRGLIEEQRRIKGRKETLGHQIGHLESQLRSANQSLESSKGRSRRSYIDRIQQDLADIDRDLNNAKTELPQLDQNPFELELAALEREESEIESRIYSFWTPQRAPPALINQLKRETEAVLRAEAALTLERRQKSICDETKNLSRYHINTSPQFDIDEEARTTLLRGHFVGEQVPDRQIAKIVLEMCEQHHIRG